MVQVHENETLQLTRTVEEKEAAVAQLTALARDTEAEASTATIEVKPAKEEIAKLVGSRELIMGNIMTMQGRMGRLEGAGAGGGGGGAGVVTGGFELSDDGIEAVEETNELDPEVTIFCFSASNSRILSSKYDWRRLESSSLEVNVL